MESEPGYKNALDQTTQGILRGLSIKGNPADNPSMIYSALNDVNKGFAYPALTQYRNQNAATGGYSAYNTAAPETAVAQAGSQAGLYNAIGGGLGNLLELS